MLGDCAYEWAFNGEDGYFGGQDGVPIVLVKEMVPSFRIRNNHVDNLLQFDFGGLCGASTSHSSEIHIETGTYLDEERVEDEIPGVVPNNVFQSTNIDRTNAVEG